MILDNPLLFYTRIDDDREWKDLDVNRIFRLQCFRHGGIGRSVKTVQRLLEIARTNQGYNLNPPLGLRGAVPWKFRVVTVPITQDKEEELRIFASMKQLSDVSHAHCPGLPFWQVAGSNNLLHARNDFISLVADLNYSLTGDRISLAFYGDLEVEKAEFSRSVKELLRVIADEVKARGLVHCEISQSQQNGCSLSPNPSRLSGLDGQQFFPLDAEEYNVQYLNAFSVLWTDVMQLVVFITLSPKLLLRCAQVCKAWSVLASHDVLWIGHLNHLNQSLRILDKNQLQASVGKIVADGLVTYKYLYKVTFLEALRRKREEGDHSFKDLSSLERRLRLSEAGDHDMRRLMLRGLYGITNGFRNGLKDIEDGITFAGRDMRMGTIGGALTVGTMAAKVGNKVPIGGQVAKRACAVGGAVIGGLTGALGGSIAGTMSAVPRFVSGCVAKPLHSLADILEETAHAINHAPEDMFGELSDQNQSYAFTNGSEVGWMQDKNAAFVRELDSGLKLFYAHVQKGFTGLYKHPHHGAQAEGIAGFATGSGRAVAGCLCSPLAGSLFVGRALARGVALTLEAPLALPEAADELDFDEVHPDQEARTSLHASEEPPMPDAAGMDALDVSVGSERRRRMSWSVGDIGRVDSSHVRVQRRSRSYPPPLARH
uniref:F-box domain-containing protein n=1 Tax=Guillardia theta TaxID=55529 RepID=A0A7S4P7X2_GUITH|mmetsp:Transcript_44903/g.141369  ORF Transcript_44903/g.141369 Transcript_44903/m.141369 type:complete len:656 (+) Transcript_44903:426-2393(+)